MASFMKKKFRAPAPDFRADNKRPKAQDARPKLESNLIYGASPVLEALRAEHRRIDKVLIADGAKEHRLSQILDLCRTRSIAWNHVPRETLAKHLDPGVNHQGVIAFTASADYV